MRVLAFTCACVRARARARAGVCFKPTSYTSKSGSLIFTVIAWNTRVPCQRLLSIVKLSARPWLQNSSLKYFYLANNH